MKSLAFPKTPARKTWRRRTESLPSSFTQTRTLHLEPQMLLKVSASVSALIKHLWCKTFILILINMCKYLASEFKALSKIDLQGQRLTLVDSHSSSRLKSNVSILLLLQQPLATPTPSWATQRRGSSTTSTVTCRHHPAPPSRVTVGPDSTAVSTATLRPTSHQRSSSIFSLEEDFQQVGVISAVPPKRKFIVKGTRSNFGHGNVSTLHFPWALTVTEHEADQTEWHNEKV